MEKKTKVSKKTSVKLSPEESQARIDLIDKMLEIMKFELNAKFPTSFTKKLKELKESYSYVEVKYAIFKLEQNLVWAVENKEFQSDYNKVNYLMAIVQNNINQYRKELNEINKKQMVMQKSNDSDLSAINDNRIIKRTQRIDMSELLD
jgi:hypothetical protein